MTELLLSADNGEMAGLGLEQIYQRYYRYVYQICYKMLLNAADAEDITQDVFLQVKSHLAGFQGKSSFTTWLYRIAVNQVLMRFRKRSVRTERVTDDGEMPDLVDQNSLGAIPDCNRI